MNQNNNEKKIFKEKISNYLNILKDNISDSNNEWKIRGFIDVLKNIYSLSSDTKIISKILEINIFPSISKFAKDNGYVIELASHQNYYPDLTFIKIRDNNVKFALDIKTTFRKNSEVCNGFTLGSHGEYFIDRNSLKNIQYPYSSYLGHFCLGIIYDRNIFNIDETKIYSFNDLKDIPSVASNFIFFIAEKWKIASDKSGSGNTANIGSIKNIDDIVNEKGIFSKYDESLFDEYWMNYGKINYTDNSGKVRVITNIKQFLEFKNKND